MTGGRARACRVFLHEFHRHCGVQHRRRRQHHQVPDRVLKGQFFPEVEHHPDGIEPASDQNQRQGARIPSDTLREMERLANESRTAKEKLAQAESRARRLAALHTATASAQEPPSLVEQLHTWHFAVLAALGVVLFVLGHLWADFLVRRRHGGFRL